MSPIVKKALISVGAMKAIEKINEKRNPPPKKSRVGKLFFIGATIGALAYAYNSGKLQPIIDKLRGATSGERPRPTVRAPGAT